MSDKYEFVDITLTEPNNAFPVTKMCVWLGVSKSGFYDWVSRPESVGATRRAELAELITIEFEAADGAAGYRRVHAALTRRGVSVGRELVRHLMRQLGLVACQPRPRTNLTTPDPAATGQPHKRYAGRCPRNAGQITLGCPGGSGRRRDHRDLGPA